MKTGSRRPKNGTAVKIRDLAYRYTLRAILREGGANVAGRKSETGYGDIVVMRDARFSHFDDACNVIDGRREKKLA